MPSSNRLGFESASTRSLATVVSLLANADSCHVIRTLRIDAPTAVALRSKTIYVRDDAGWFDLLLAARLLTRRANARLAGMDSRVDARTIGRWIREELTHLRSIYETRQLERFSLFRQRDRATYPEAWWENVPLKDLPDLGNALGGGKDEHGAGATGERTLEPLQPVIVRDGSSQSSDADWFLKQLRNGNIPTILDPRLGIHVAQNRFNIVPEPFQGYDEEYIDRLIESRREAIEAFKLCYLRTTDERTISTPDNRRFSEGNDIDTDRLADLAIDPEPRLFKLKMDRMEPEFNPEKHLHVVLYDLNSNLGSLHSLGFSSLLASCLMAVPDELGIESTLVLGFADSLVSTDDGNQVYVQNVGVIKEINDPFSVGWDRFHRVFGMSRDFSLFEGGQKSMYAPLALELVKKQLRGMEEEYEVLSVTYVFPRTFPSDAGKFSSPAFCRSTVEEMEKAFDYFEGRFSTVRIFGWTAPALKSEAKKGERLSLAQVL